MEFMVTKKNKNVQTPPLLMTISKLITERKWQDLRLFADFRRKKKSVQLEPDMRATDSNICIQITN